METILGLFFFTLLIVLFAGGIIRILQMFSEPFRKKEK